MKNTISSVKEKVKTSGKNSTKTSNATDIPLMNIDGINFGSDDYYNDFYDGDFELVDDAVIPYQEEDNEWFSDTSFENPSSSGVIIHDEKSIASEGSYGLKVQQPSPVHSGTFSSKICLVQKF